MNVLGIIAEYNPMHNGHIYQLKQAKLKCNADIVVIIMSGSFTQQGNISVYSKFDKASIAIQNGADIVIELPVVHSTSSAENFAYSAVNILNNLGIITHLSFGAECDDITLLNNIAKKLVINENKIIAETKEHLKTGINAASARSLALNSILDTSEHEQISKPNNILAIEYLKALIKLNSKIIPIVIKRVGNGHNDSNKAQIYSSSSYIRNCLNAQNYDDIKDFIPQNVSLKLASYPHNSNEALWEILKYQILKIKEEGIKNIQDVSEGLEKKIYSDVFKSNSYDEYIMNVKSKRYTVGRIKRICVYILLNVTKEQYQKLSTTYYARILKVSNKGKKMLSKINNSITKITDKTLKEFPENIKNSLTLNILSHNLFFEDKNKDYTNRIEI